VKGETVVVRNEIYHLRRFPKGSDNASLEKGSHGPIYSTSWPSSSSFPHQLRALGRILGMDKVELTTRGAIIQAKKKLKSDAC
jgi:hypothetical protein